jgi:hypothetical protein
MEGDSEIPGEKSGQKTGEKLGEKAGQKTEERAGQKTEERAGQKTEERAGQKTEERAGLKSGETAGELQQEGSSIGGVRSPEIELRMLEGELEAIESGLKTPTNDIDTGKVKVDGSGVTVTKVPEVEDSESVGGVLATEYTNSNAGESPQPSSQPNLKETTEPGPPSRTLGSTNKPSLRKSAPKLGSYTIGTRLGPSPSSGKARTTVRSTLPLMPRSRRQRRNWRLSGPYWKTMPRSCARRSWKR